MMDKYIHGTDYVEKQSLKKLRHSRNFMFNQTKRKLKQHSTINFMDKFDSFWVCGYNWEKLVKNCVRVFCRKLNFFPIEITSYTRKVQKISPVSYFGVDLGIDMMMKYGISKLTMFSYFCRCFFLSCNFSISFD